MSLPEKYCRLCDQVKPAEAFYVDRRQGGLTTYCRSCNSGRYKTKRLPLTATLAERLDFHSIPEPNSGCLLWLGATNCGYGMLRIEGKWRKAHRLSWTVHRGPIPDGLFACHKCDNRLCINPQHLFLGTNAENVADMDTKGRRVSAPQRGENNPQAKLTEDQVIAIRGDGRSLQRIADDYCVHKMLISMIKNRRIWRHVT